MKKSIMLGGLSVLTSLLLIGCGGGSTTSVDSDGTSTGTFIDAEVEGVEYSTSSGIEGTTDSKGQFKYRAGDKVEFRIGKLILGAGEPKASGLITPRELTDNNETMTLLLQTLQSLDADGDTSNGIQIPSKLITDLEDLDETHHIKDLDEASLLSLSTELKNHLDKNQDDSLDVDENEAHQHFIQSENQWKAKHEAKNEKKQKKGKGKENQTGPVVDVDKYYTYNLTQELKDSLSYMGNEERLAYDVYKNLYQYYNDTSLTVLNNIADKSEKRHIATVRAIVDKYNINSTELTNIDKDIVGDGTTNIDDVKGQYDIQQIQDLYDALFAKGTTSKQDALEVGCMVEVTDINDLNNYIEMAKTANVKDIEVAFTELRKGSYDHYWAFDKALKDMGVTDGCCSLGTIDGVNYCHSDDEYPQNEHGN